jgi:hypothetical protein
MFGRDNEVDWNDMKAFLDERKLPAQYIKFRNTYWIMGADGPFQIWCRIPIANTEQGDTIQPDEADFVANYLPNANTVLTDSRGHAIVRQSAFSDSEGFRARFKGFRDVASKNDTQDPEKVSDLDFQIPEERYINGIRLILTNHVDDDRLDFIIVDKDYLYAGILYPAQYDDGNGNLLDWNIVAPNGIELDEFGTDWYVDDTQKTQPDVITPYPARIFAGLYVRIRYHALGQAENITVKVNTYLHKKG